MRRHDTPSTDIIEPTTLVFVGVDVEGDSVLLPYLYVELIQTILAEDGEGAMAGEVVFYPFNDKVLTFPSGSCTV